MVGVARIELATPTMSIVFNTMITLPYSDFHHNGIVSEMLKITTVFERDELCHMVLKLCSIVIAPLSSPQRHFGIWGISCSGYGPAAEETSLDKESADHR